MRILNQNKHPIITETIKYDGDIYLRHTYADKTFSWTPHSFDGELFDSDELEAEYQALIKDK
jgi:hypothetical protein